MNLFGLAATLALSAPAVINPRFTPADLVRMPARIFVLKVAAPKDKALTAEVVETLKGTPLPQKTLKLELSEGLEVAEDDLAGVFDGKTAAAGLLVLSPATIGLQEPGPVLLEWMGADGKRQKRQVIVEHPARVELAPGA